MIPLKISITADHRLGRGEWGKIMQQAWGLAGGVVKRQALPRHFGPSAATEYGYAPRTREWEARKLRTHGHRRPLEATGELRRRAENRGRVKPGKAKVRVTLTGLPAYVGRRGRGPDIQAELEAVSERDVSEVAAAMEEFILQELSRAGPRRRIV